MYTPWNNFLSSISTDTNLASWLQVLPQQLLSFKNSTEGKEYEKYIKLFERVSNLHTHQINLNTEYVTFGDSSKITSGQQVMLKKLFTELMPWRKGPYEFFGEKIESEWRSFKKWDRLLPHISSLKDRTVLDVGCGNGYHMWRILGEGAKRVVGIDPCALFLAQFQLMKDRILDTDLKNKINFLPLGIENLPNLNAFDSVFSMGVLYHRRSPVDHLYQLQNQLRPGGELILETLVIEGDENTVLIPKDRYAKMPNVWYIPSVKALEVLLNRCGFIDVKFICQEMTTEKEQRSTNLMQTESLLDFLNPNDHSKTIEGYQAPTRAIFTAHKKG
ncbi:MAG: tRNA 5-methoxyuridine(34)/uridine 5-oxyacetic acid(34) synthase CmoB [Succinivibrionaceae bacterium]